MKFYLKYIWILLLVPAAAIGSMRAEDFNPTNPPEPLMQVQVTISANPADGVSSISPASGSYAYDKKLSLSVKPKSNYNFLYWTLNGVQYSTSATTSYTVGDSAVAFVAVLQKKTTLTVSKNISAAGSVYGGGTYLPDTKCHIYAKVNEGYKFLYWSLNGEPQSADMDLYFTIGEEDLEYIAVFEKNETPDPGEDPGNPEPFEPGSPPEPLMAYSVTISTDLPDGIMPASISKGGYFKVGQMINISTAPNADYAFKNWTLNGVVHSSSQSFAYTMGDSAATFVAHFVQKQHISVSVTPEEAATVSGTGLYAPEKQVTISTSPKTGYTFQHWTRNGELYSMEKSFSYTVENEAASFVAVYKKTEDVEIEDDGTPFNPSNPPEPEAEQNALLVTVVSSSTVKGTVSGVPTTPLFAGNSITITATPNQGYTFDHWSDGNKQNPRTIKLTGDLTLVAHFEAIEYAITFMNGDQVLKAIAVKYGTTPTYEGEIPTKAATSQFTYTFAGWKPEIVPVVGEATYVAQFDSVSTTPPSVNTFTIVWVNYDGSVLESDTDVPEGTIPTYDGEEPTKPKSEQYTYTFAGWKPTVEAAICDTVYTATFDSTQNAQVQDVHNIVIQGEHCKIYVIAEFPESSNVTVQADADATPSFKQWSDGQTELPRTVQTVKGDSTAAEFERLKYTITAQP